MKSGEPSSGAVLASSLTMRLWVGRLLRSRKLLIMAACSCPLSLLAQWTVQPAVEARVTAAQKEVTSAGVPLRADIYSLLRPAIRIVGRGPNFDLSLNAAVELVSYARGTQPDRALPLLESGLKSVLVDRLVYFDANAAVRQTEVDAFAPSNESGSTFNRRSTASYRLSPYLLREFSPRISVLARHDESQTKQSGDDGTDLRSHYSVARLSGKPVPLGFLLEVSRLLSGTRAATTSELRVIQAKAGVSVALFDEVVLGVVAGSERTRLLLTDQDDGVYGVNLRWAPSPRTELYGNLERRFFGNGGELRFNHRTPFTSLSIRANREPVTATTSLGVIGAGGGDVSSVLDAILSRSTPDPVQRAVLVQNLISTRGLQTSVPGAVDILAAYPQLQTGLTASWVYLGSRTTTSLSGLRQSLRQLTRNDAVVLVPVADDSVQTSAALEVSYRLDTQTSVNSGLRWSHIRGLSITEGSNTRERSLRFALVRSLDPRTEMTLGAQYKVVDNNKALVRHQTPSLAFVGMTHRF